MLNQTTRYVLSVLCFLANQGEGPVPARRIAAETGTPANYVAKILGTLSKRGVVLAEKGWGGGYALSPLAVQVPLDDLLRLFDDHPGPVECPFPDPICGCRVAQQRVGGGESLPHAVTRDGRVVCPYGEAECVNQMPCPLQAHWAKVREGYRALAVTRLGELAERVAG